MAIVGTKVEMMREGNTNVAVKTDVVLDMETGAVLERKTVLAAAPTASGDVAMITAQRTSVTALPVYYDENCYITCCN